MSTSSSQDVRADALVGLVLAAAMVTVAVHAYADYPLDLHVYLVGGRASLTGHDLYAPAVAVRGYGFTYPPFAALVFALPSLLRAGVAITVLTVLSLASLAVVLRLCGVPDVVSGARRSGTPGGWRRVAERDAGRWVGIAVTVALIWSEPVRLTIWNGQINLVLMALVLVDLFVVPSGRRGVLIGVATAIKLTPGLFIVYLLAAGQARAARNAALTVLGAVALTWVVRPHDSARFWLHTVLSDTGIGDTARIGNQSIDGVLQRAFGKGSVATAAWLGCALVVAAVGVATATAVARRGEDVLAAGVVGVTACLVSPVAWTHHWVWSIPVVAGLLARPRSTRLKIGIAVLVVLFVSGCNDGPFHADLQFAMGRATTGNGYVLAGLAVLAALAYEQRRERLVR